MRLLKLTFILVSVVYPFAVFAQANILKPVVQSVAHPAQGARLLRSPFEQALRLGGLAYMVPNSRVGAEALHRGIASQVGTAKPTLKTNLQYKAYELCARRLSTTKLDALVERHVVREPFPAYYTSFPREWQKFRENVDGKLGTLEVILEAAYGPSARFSGCFLQTYSEVVDFSKHLETDGEPAADALAKAYSQGMEKGNGFFVVRVQATKEYPQDVLLLDVKDVEHPRWISMRQSIGGEWMDLHWIEEK